MRGGWSGEGNIDADPLFVDAANGDLRLRSDSPRRNRGLHESLPANVADLHLTESNTLPSGDSSASATLSGSSLESTAPGDTVDMGAKVVAAPQR